ncbi:M48 family metallopeptidase [Corynebacterium pelargi]|uniref:YgjP-like metallopeptidase domain-containing protein n=1 Tax=Corynebacterium pelargi TaxID=1471400 RepID=A0A410WA96_9CORY|nr:M48 family metallopeptidase [Corynebacterium pelargi]QAU52898.1 hypothetical protein CPELA_08215 [Corynebacterium pelargi]GGG76182.1 hypothetical protein GCM10007338_12360 [Corynebacterium pelargi]
MEVDIIRSKRRKKTVAARVVDGRIQVRVPYGMKPDEEAAVVEQLRRKLESRQDHESLQHKAEELNRRYLQSRAQWSAIRWVSNQQHRWGSYSPQSGEIRISDRLYGVPEYVLDSVIVHELAHSIEPNHSKAFWDLAGRVAHAERARGFLEGLQYRQR